MITAVDTDVLLDVFVPDDQHGPRSRGWLAVAYNAGAIENGWIYRGPKKQSAQSR